MRLDLRTDPAKTRYYQVVNQDTGQIIPEAIAADDEEGWYEVYKTDEKGNRIKDVDGDPIVLIKQAKIRFKYLGAVP